jgi:hypothetical protein
LLRDENKGNAGSWVVKKVGDRVELRPTVDFAEALSKWFIKNERDPAWTIEFRETTERDSMDESKKITKGMVLKMLREEFQNVMSEDDEEEESTEFAEAIAALERMRGKLKGIAAEIADFRGARRESNALNAQIDNLEGIIDRLKEVPGAPLGTDIYMAHPGLDPES